MADDEQTDERDRALNRHGELDPSIWHEQEAVTDRPNDLVKDQVENSSFRDRATTRQVNAKQVSGDEAEDKAVTSAEAKKAAKPRARSAKKR